MDVYVCKEERGHKTETVKVILIPGYTSLCSAPNERNRKHICGSLSCLLHHHYDSITIHLNLKCTMYNITDPSAVVVVLVQTPWKNTFLASTNKKRKFTSIFALYWVECFTTNNLVFGMECVSQCNAVLWWEVVVVYHDKQIKYGRNRAKIWNHDKFSNHWATNLVAQSRLVVTIFYLLGNKKSRNDRKILKDDSPKEYSGFIHLTITEGRKLFWNSVEGWNSMRWSNW